MSAPPAASGRPRGPIIAAIAAVVLLVLVAALMLLRSDRGTVPSATSSPSASASASASSAAAATATPGTGAGLGPDAKHGLITFEGIRTEASATNLQQPPQFSRTGATFFSVAVSPDGKRVAVVRRGEAAAGQGLIMFTTARPNDITQVVDFTGTGETVGFSVWAADGSDSVLIAVDKLLGIQPDATAEYSSLRSVDLNTKRVTEIARITTGARLSPLAWLPARGLAAAAEVLGGGAKNYDLIRSGAIERTPINAPILVQLRGSRDGSRILVVIGPGLRWWPMDQPAAGRDLQPDSKGRAEYAEFRPGTNEIGVSVAAASTGAVGSPGHFEIWDLSSGKQRVVSPTVGFSRWRADGSAAISGTTLVDPDTGATTPLPGGAFKIVEVVLF